MVAASSSPWTASLFSIALTWAGPPLLVRTLLAIFYRAFPAVRPAPSHQRTTHTALVCLFLLYSILSTFRGLPINFYDLLGVPVPLLSTTLGIKTWRETVLRPRWLPLVKAFHPDKLGGSEAAQAYFRKLQRANEVLKSDSLRSAYDKYGPHTAVFWPSNY